MRDRRGPAAWRWALALLPARFRERYREDMESALGVHLEGAGRVRRTVVWGRAVADALVWAVRMRRGGTGGGAGATSDHGTGGAGTMGTMRDNLTYAVRALARRPGFTLVAVVTLGIGIGANTAMFSVVDGVLLEPLPYRAADRIGILWHEFGNGAQNLPALHPLDLYDYRERSDLIEAATLASGREWILGTDDDTDLVDVGLVEHGFFEFFGAAPELGRTFTEEDDRPGAAHVVMLSHRLWERRYGSDPDIVGERIDVAGTRMEVRGVLPASFRLSLPAEAFLLRDAELWFPARVDANRLPPRNFTGFTGFVRLRPGVSWEQAQDEVEAMAARLREEHPVHASSNLYARVEPLRDDVVKGARATLNLLLGAVGFVLLIACANVANLARVPGRQRRAELAVRAALGARGSRLAGLVVAEGLIVAGLGAFLGLALAYGGVEALRTWAGGSVPRLEVVGIDPTVLAFTAAVTGLSVVLFGVLPALQAARQQPGEVLQADVRGGVGARGRFQDALIVGQVAASLVLLVGTGLMVRSVVALGSVDPGYAMDDVLTLRLNLPGGAFDGREETEVFRQDLFDGIRGLPGVRSVAAVSQLPLTGSGPLQPYAYDEESASNWESVTADQRGVSAGFFETVGARMLAGREFTQRDILEDDGIVIDDRLAERAFGSVGAAVGRRLQIRPNEVPEEERYMTVIGVVDHLRLHDLSAPYLSQIWFPSMGDVRYSLVIRSDGTVRPEDLVAPVRGEIAARVSGAAVEDVRSMAELAARSLAPVRLTLALMTGFGMIALLLASVGIYGVLAWAVSQRTREIGVRMALGEAPADVRRSVLAEGGRLVAVAVVVGLIGAAALAAVAEGLWYGVEPLDPGTYLATTGLLAAVAMLACWLPARRATRVDPAAALREA